MPVWAVSKPQKFIIMKKLIITCALVSLGSVASFAQAPQAAAQSSATTAAPARGQAPSAELIAEQRAQIYKKDLGLNDDQYQKVYKAQLDFIKRDQTARANGGAPGPGQSQQMQMGMD